MTDERADQNTGIDESIVETGIEETPQYGVGPFSVRELAIVGVWLVAFIVSFFSIATERAMIQLLIGGSVWTNGLDWILTIGVPTVAVFLIVLRRFSPDGIRRVGSLGIDQFASVAFSVSAMVWLGSMWRNIAVAVETGVWIYSWVAWVQLFLMLAGVVLTVAARVIPVFAEDFAGRREIPAHRNARPIRPISPRPPRPVPPAPEQSDTDAPVEGSSGETAVAADATAPPADGEPEPKAAVQAFWALTPEERPVVDESGDELFMIGPSAWALVLEDRGDVFVIRHEDGRVGYLNDVSDVTRG